METQNILSERHNQCHCEVTGTETQKILLERHTISMVSNSDRNTEEDCQTHHCQHEAKGTETQKICQKDTSQLL